MGLQSLPVIPKLNLQVGRKYLNTEPEPNYPNFENTDDDNEDIEGDYSTFQNLQRLKNEKLLQPYLHYNAIDKTKLQSHNPKQSHVPMPLYQKYSPNKKSISKDIYRINGADPIVPIEYPYYFQTDPNEKINNKVTWDELNGLNYYDFKHNGKINFNPNSLLKAEDDDDIANYNYKFNRNYLVDESKWRNKYGKESKERYGYLSSARKERINSGVSRNERVNSYQNVQYYVPNTQESNVTIPANPSDNYNLQKRTDYINSYDHNDINNRLIQQKRQMLLNQINDPYYNINKDSDLNDKNSIHNSNHSQSYHSLKKINSVKSTLEKAQKEEKVWEDKRTKVRIHIILTI